MNVVSPQKKQPRAANVLLDLLTGIKVGQLEVLLPNGEQRVFGSADDGLCSRLIFNDWSACLKILKSSDIGLAEAYRDHHIEISDITALLRIAMANESSIQETFEGSFLGKITYLIRHFLLNRNTRKGSKRNIHAHYDLGNAFYSLWLDESMTYSSAIFSQPSVTLKEAQIAKYERILSQINPQAGNHILEIGCGWGGFAEYAAQTRGVRVTGISLSNEQLTWAKHRVKGTAIESLCEFRFQDYRDVDGQFDAVVSIEMIEAVGENYWPSYFTKINHVLKPNGLAAIQAITIRDELFERYRRSTDFIQQFIFPGGMLLSNQQIKLQAENADLQINDVFCFGLDYAETLRRWRFTFEQYLTQVMQQGFDDAFIRIWRFYLAYCEAAFDAKRIDVCQVILQKK